MKVTWTKAAEQHFLVLLHENPKATGIQLSVKKMGCSGYGYDVSILETFPDNVEKLSFAESYSLFISKKDLPLLGGINIDYVKIGVNAKLVFNNPNQTGQCGCGESFTV